MNAVSLVAHRRVVTRDRRPWVPAEPDQRNDWLALVDKQHGIVRCEQLTEFGISRSAIYAHMRAHRWRHVVHRVYATFTGPLSRDAQLSAALLYAGPAAILSHRTAAEQWRMWPAAPGPVHVTVPYGHSATSQGDMIIVHRSRAFAHFAVAGVRPVTSRADTVIDVAVDEPTARRAMSTATSLLTSRRVSAAEVARRLVERPPRRYRKPLEAAVRRVLTGVQSVLEESYAVDVEYAHGLPSAVRQTPVVVDGITLFEDAVYDHLGVPLTVRLDGRSHLTPAVAHRDRRRDNAAELAGRSRLVFGWTEVSSNPCGVATEAAGVLRRYGWCGPLLECPRCRSGS